MVTSIVYLASGEFLGTALRRARRRSPQARCSCHTMPSTARVFRLAMDDRNRVYRRCALCLSNDDRFAFGQSEQSAAMERISSAGFPWPSSHIAETTRRADRKQSRLKPRQTWKKQLLIEFRAEPRHRVTTARVQLLVGGGEHRRRTSTPIAARVMAAGGAASSSAPSRMEMCPRFGFGGLRRGRGLKPFRLR